MREATCRLFVVGIAAALEAACAGQAPGPSLPARRATVAPKVPVRRARPRRVAPEPRALRPVPVDVWKGYFTVLHGARPVGRAYLGYERNDEGEQYELRQAVRTAWGLVTRKAILQVDERGAPVRLRVTKMEQVAGSQIRLFSRYEARRVGGAVEVTTTQFGYRWRRRLRAPGAVWGARAPLLLGYYAARRLSGAPLAAERPGTALDLEAGKLLPFRVRRTGRGAKTRVHVALGDRQRLEVRYDAGWAKVLGAAGAGGLPSYRLGGKPPVVPPPPRGFDRAAEVKPFSWPASLVDSPVRIPVGKGGGAVSARRTVPAGRRPHPAVVLVPAADTRDLDGTRGLRVFYKELAALLGGAGFVVYRFAPRGVAPTGGDRERVTLRDWMEDLAAVLRHVRRDRAVRRGRVFLLGHGEGGLLALRYATRQGAWLRGLVLVSTPGVEYSAYILDRWRRRWETAGMAVETVNQRLAWFRKQLDRVARGQRRAFLGRPGGVMAGLLRVDPLVAYRRLRLRTLILAGQADITVREDDANALRAAMPRNRRIHVVRPPGVGHLLQHSPRFLELSEMWKVPAPVAPAAARPLLGWLRAQSR